jgi:hypothetical protein
MMKRSVHRRTSTVSVIVVWMVLLGMILPGATAMSASKSSSTGKSSTVQFRWGRVSDRWTIAFSQIRNLQTVPLICGGFEPNNLLVAEQIPSVKDGGVKMIGWAQIRPLGCYDQERDPLQFDAPPGSYDLEADIDDQMWQEFFEWSEGRTTTS